jgi:hypothetical protein
MRVIGVSLALWLGSVLTLAAETGYFPKGIWGPPEGARTVGEP